MNNTSLLYPLSGETIIHGGTGTTSYTTTDTGIVYLAGMFTAAGDTITVSINSRSLTFSASLYAENNYAAGGEQTIGYMSTGDTRGGSDGSFFHYKGDFKPKFVNLLQPIADFYVSKTIGVGGMYGYNFSGGGSTSIEHTLVDPKLDACCPTDRNKGPYLPVKKGDVFAFSGTGKVIASYLYF